MEQLRLGIGLSAGVLAILASVVYLLAILRGETKPDRGANVVWGVTSTISFFAYWAGGAEDSVWFAGGDFVVGVVMFFLALKYGYGWTNKRHMPALAVALAGLLLWSITDDPFLALLCSASVDAVGYVLIVIKSYEAPASEDVKSWVIYLIAAILALLAVHEASLLVLFYPVYVIVATTAVLLAIAIGNRRTGHRKKSRKSVGRIP
jgi:hypothetical protein